MKDIIIRARKRIETADRWTKNAPARDASGAGVDVLSPDAVCWCAWGAVHAEAPPDLVLPAALAVEAVEVALRYVRRTEPERYDEPAESDERDIGTLNDEPETTHADVLAAFDLAIAADGDADTVRMYGLGLVKR